MPGDVRCGEALAKLVLVEEVLEDCLPAEEPDVRVVRYRAVAQT